MKISEVTVDYLIIYCNAYDDANTKKDMNVLLAGVKSFIKSYTGLNDETIDELEDITLVLLSLVSDMYDNRNFTIEKDKINPIYKSILDMHSINYL